jgi:phosphoribosylformylglycinamidine synthase PurS subunit
VAPTPRAKTSQRFEIRIALKPGVADAEGESVERSLALLGIPGVRSVRTARVFELAFEGLGPRAARARADEAVARLLANPVIHRVHVRPLSD